MKVRAEYFAKVQKALKREAIAEPLLVVDGNVLNANISQLKPCCPAIWDFALSQNLCPAAHYWRISLPRADTDRLMTFNATMALQMLDLMPAADQLMGKPLPIAAVSSFFRTLPARKRAEAARQIQFLVDTPQRFTEMRNLAHDKKLHLRVNLEIDVGLHRGGMEPGAEIDNVLQAIANTPNIELSGLMGYEPHLSKIPKLKGWRNRARKGATDAFGCTSASGGAFLTCRNR